MSQKLNEVLLAEWRAGLVHNPRVAQVLVGVRPDSFTTPPEVETVLTYFHPTGDAGEHGRVMTKLCRLMPHTVRVLNGPGLGGLRRLVWLPPSYHPSFSQPWQQYLPLLVHGSSGDSDRILTLVLGFLVADEAQYRWPIHVASVGILEVAWCMHQLNQFMRREGLVFPQGLQEADENGIRLNRLHDYDVAVMMWRLLAHLRLHYNIFARRVIEIAEVMRQCNTSDLRGLPTAMIPPDDFVSRVSGTKVSELFELGSSERQRALREIYQAFHEPVLVADFDAWDQWRRQSESSRGVMNGFAFRLLVRLVAMSQVMNETPAIELGPADEPTEM